MNYKESVQPMIHKLLIRKFQLVLIFLICNIFSNSAKAKMVIEPHLTFSKGVGNQDVIYVNNSGIYTLYNRKYEHLGKGGGISLSYETSWWGVGLQAEITTNEVVWDYSDTMDDAELNDITTKRNHTNYDIFGKYLISNLANISLSFSPFVKIQDTSGYSEGAYFSGNSYGAKFSYNFLYNISFNIAFRHAVLDKYTFGKDYGKGTNISLPNEWERAFTSPEPYNQKSTFGVYTFNEVSLALSVDL